MLRYAQHKCNTAPSRLNRDNLVIENCRDGNGQFEAVAANLRSFVRREQMDLGSSALLEIILEFVFQSLDNEY